MGKFFERVSVLKAGVFSGYGSISIKFAFIQEEKTNYESNKKHAKSLLSASASKAPISFLPFSLQ